MQTEALKEKEERKRRAGWRKTEEEGEIKSRWISLKEVETPGIVGEDEEKRGEACGLYTGASWERELEVGKLI